MFRYILRPLHEYLQPPACCSDILFCSYDLENLIRLIFAARSNHEATWSHISFLDVISTFRKSYGRATSSIQAFLCIPVWLYARLLRPFAGCDDVLLRLHDILSPRRLLTMMESNNVPIEVIHWQPDIMIVLRKSYSKATSSIEANNGHPIC